MKASRCLDHNAKKFRKTVFYQYLKQTSQMNVAVDIPDTCKHQEEGPSYQPDTAVVENTHVTDITEDSFSIQTDIYVALENTEKATEGIIVDECQK
ncbi:hypothetical protein HPULCUR_005238 [Helicostylum pulchrum]|uniref:Uncharacterized protein n=1 Tax=Helicostylum pulchrum TaxID=562976 RepID=A0ABP9XYG8_9FUNG